MIKFLQKYWPLLLIIALSFVLRIYKIEELFYFTYDESIPTFVGRRLILWHHVPLIGGVTPFNFHLAPYFYWFYALLLFIGKLNPVIWGFAGALVAAITTLMMFIVGKEFGSKKIGLTASILWTFSYLANVYDRHLWALYWGPLVSLTVLFSLQKIIKGQKNFIYPLAIITALSIHADLSNLAFLVLSVCIWFIYKLKIDQKTLIAIGIIIISFLPLIVFDLRHNFANTKPVIKFWKTRRNNPGFESQKFINNSLSFPATFTRLIYTFGDNEIAKQYSYCRNYVSEKYGSIAPILILFSSLTMLGFLIWSFKKENRNSWRLAGLSIVIYFIGIQIYGTVFKADIFEHYLTGLFAVFLLISSKLISLMPGKIWLLALALFVSVNVFKLSKIKSGLGLSYKKQAIEFTMSAVGDNPFSLESLSTCWRYSGYRYLFALYAKEPVKSYVDPNFGYLYGTTPIAERHPQTVVAFVVHDFVPETDAFYQKYALYKSHEIKNGLFGNIEVIIMDNTPGWFDEQ